MDTNFDADTAMEIAERMVDLRSLFRNTDFNRGVPPNQLSASEGSQSEAP